MIDFNIYKSFLCCDTSNIGVKSNLFSFLTSPEGMHPVEPEAVILFLLKLVNELSPSQNSVTHQGFNFGSKLMFGKFNSIIGKGPIFSNNEEDKGLFNLFTKLATSNKPLGFK